MKSPTRALVFFCALAAPLAAQGPGSCGFHLDIDANLTSTHSAVADMPGAPGSAFAPYPAGVPGNPYTAWCTPGTTFKLKLSVPPSLLGPLPIGAGSVLTIFWALGTPNLPIIPPPTIMAPCVPGEPLVISVVPFGGAVVDGLGVLTPPPPFTVAADPGHPYKFEYVGLYPAFAPIAIPVMFQALLMTPGGVFAISNAVALMAGPNPAEVSLVPGLVPCGPFPATDEGWALGVPTPPGFALYGVPMPTCNVNTNGFVDFSPPLPVPPCDFTGAGGDLAVSPRLAVNHHDTDLALPPTAPRIADLTMEFAPPFPPLPSRLILRWKNVVHFAAPPAPPDTSYSSFVAELWGADTPMFPLASRIACVRQEMRSVTSLANHDMIGIGPGPIFGPAPAPLATPLWPLYGLPPLIGPPAGGIFMDTAPAIPGLVDSAMLSNLSTVFDPIAFIIPGAYSVAVY